MLQTLVAGLATGGIYGLLAVGIVLVYRGSRVLNFAQGELGTFALFIAWELSTERAYPWLIGAIAAVAVVGLVGFGFERLIVSRMKDATRLSVAVATAGLLLLLLAVELKIWGGSPKIVEAPIAGLGPKLAGFFVSPTTILALLATIAIGAGLAAFLRRTDFGLGVLAAAQDATAVRLVGVPLSRVSAFTWTTAAVIAAIAALLVEPTIGSFSPGFMTLLFVRALAAALLGGLDSLPGAFLGGAVIGVVEATVGDVFVASSIPGLQTLSVFAIILAVLLVRPAGLLGKVARA